MQLSNRLKSVVDLVTPGNRVADVGCDHAYISIYLAEHRISPHIIAMDINQGPILRAKENIIRYGYETLIEVRKSDGLELLEIGEADTVILAGMGGGLVVQILTKRPEIMKSVRELVLQPQSEIHKVRQMLTDNDFVIIEENIIKEDGKYYPMMKAVPYHQVEYVENYQITKEEHLYFGRLLLEQQNQVLVQFLLWDLGLCQDIMETLTVEQSENSQLRQKEIQDRIDLIHCGLGYYDRDISKRDNN